MKTKTRPAISRTWLRLGAAGGGGRGAGPGGGTASGAGGGHGPAGGERQAQGQEEKVFRVFHIGLLSMLR